MTRDPTSAERRFIVTMADGTNWLGRTFATKDEAATEARKVGYGAPWFIAEVVGVVEG